MRTKDIFLLVLIHVSSSVLVSQDTTDIDSLLQVYKTQVVDSIRVKTVDKIFLHYLKKDPEQAEKYAQEQLKIAKRTQNPIELGIAYKNLRSFYNRSSNIEKVLFFARKELEQFKLAKNKDYLIGGYKDLSQGFYTLGQYDSVIYYLNNAQSLLLEKDKDTTSKWTYILNLKTHVYLNKSNYDLALKNGLGALKYTEKGSIKAGLLNAVGEIESLRGNYNQALTYYLESLQISQDLNSHHNLAQAYTNAGVTYSKMGNYVKAKESFLSSEKIAKNAGCAFHRAASLYHQGVLGISGEQFGEAIRKYQEASVIFKEIKATPNYGSSLHGIAIAYNRLNNYAKAVPYLNEAISISKKYEALDNLQDSYRERSVSYEGMQKPYLALQDFKKHKKLNDSVYNIAKSQQIEEMRAIFDTEKKEQQIAQQETEISLLEEKEKVSRLQKMALGGGMGLSALALGFGFYGFRQKTKRNRLEKEKVDAELAFKKSELDFKKKELTTQALQLAKKNETLENLKQKAHELKTSEVHNGYQQLITAINFDLQDDNNWENFARYFEEVHKDFNSNVAKKYPEVTPNELRLMALLKMNLSSKEIANILNISIPGIKKARQRLRKKMQLSSSDSLENAVLSI